MAAENNPFYIAPANTLQALMTGVQGFDRGQAMQKEGEIRAGREQAMGELQAGRDPSQALARLIGVGDIQGATVLAKLHETQNQQNGFYGTPVYIQDPNTKEMRVVTFNKKGNVKDLELPPGFSPTVPISYQNTATGIVPTAGRGVTPGAVAPSNSPRLQPGASPRGFAPPDPNSDSAYTFSPEEVRRANAPQPGSTAPVQPIPVQTQSIRPADTMPGYIPKDIEGQQIQEAAGKRVGEMMAAASKAPQNLGNLNRAAALLSQVETGKLLPAQITAGAWGRALGLSDETIKGLGINPAAPAIGQAARSLFNEMIIGKLGPGGFPSANFSNTDLQFITGTVMQLGDEPAANKIRLEAARRLEQQRIEKVNQWKAYKEANKGRRVSFDDFETQWNNTALQKDLFGDLQKEAEALIANATGGGGGPASAAPAAGGVPQINPNNPGWQVDPKDPRVKVRIRQQ